MFLKKYLPDIFESIEVLLTISNQNIIDVTNYDIFDYLYSLFTFTKLTKNLDDILLKTKPKNSNVYARNKNEFFYVFDNLLNLRYHFIRIISPIIDINIFLNYLELYFVYIFERAKAEQKFSKNNRISFKNSENRLCFITLFFFVFQKYDFKNENLKIREFLILKCCLCSTLENHKNLRRDFYTVFNAKYMFKNVCDFEKRYLPPKDSELFPKPILKQYKKFLKIKNVDKFKKTQMRSCVQIGIDIIIKFVEVKFI
ncbi:hypothetical protein GVAV_000887 [Gurleya vavrai]